MGHHDEALLINANKLHARPLIISLAIIDIHFFSFHIIMKQSLKKPEKSLSDYIKHESSQLSFKFQVVGITIQHVKEILN